MVSSPAANIDSKSNDQAKRKWSISIFMPFYNEVDNLPTVTQEALEVLERISDDYELIIVDDGSSDGTYELADKIASDNQNVKVVHHSTNMGYGAALQSGFRNSTKELVFYTDGDGQFDISQLADIIYHIDKYDIVSCYRADRKDSFIRKLNAFCWGIFVNCLFGMRIRDIDCAFKIYRREIFDNIEMHSTGALIDTEILARSLRKGYTIFQCPVSHRQRLTGEATGAKFSVIFKAFAELFKLWNLIRKSNK